MCVKLTGTKKRQNKDMRETCAYVLEYTVWLKLKVLYGQFCFVLFGYGCDYNIHKDLLPSIGAS